jgi:Phage capsid family
MPLATSTGEKLRTMREELNQLALLETPSAEDLEKAVKLNEEIEGVETDYAKFKAVDDANAARKAADEAEKAKSRQPVSRPGLALVQAADERNDIERELAAMMPSKKSWFEAFVNSPTYKAIHDQGHFNAMGMGYKIAVDDLVAFKAAGDPITSTQFGTRYTDPMLVPHPAIPTNVIPLISIETVTTGNVRYFQATIPIGGAPDWVAEAALKPEVQPRWAPVDAPMETLAEWTAVTLQALDDLPQLRAVLDNDLARALAVKLDWSLLNGTGTTPQIRGILNFAGVQTVAFVATTNAADMIAKGIQAVQATGYGSPNAIVMNPADWWAVRTSKIGTPPSAFYSWGMPTDTGIPSIWGVPVVQDANLAAGTALVGDFSYATFFQRLGVTFIVGLKNDDLLKNMITIVCELRGALALRRPQAFAKVALV